MCALVFDFDKTLIKEDSLFKSILILGIRQKVLIFLMLVFYGKVYLKKYLWKNNFMNFNLELNSNFLKLAYARDAYIVSGALDQFVKQALFRHLPQNRIFGTKNHNLVGGNKKKFLVKKFGYKNFDYIGDSFSDICIWRSARKSYTVKRLWLYKFFVPNLKHVDEFK